MVRLCSTFALLGVLACARERTTFDYGWRFSLGDPSDASPPLTTASLDPTFIKTANNMSCSQLAYTALGRMGENDCRGACSSTPGCRVWQYVAQNAKGTLGDDPQCVTVTPPLPMSGGQRAQLPPPVQNRSGVDWATANFDDTKWTQVDLPHDFVLLGNYSEDADGHHGYLPRDQAGWYRKKFQLPASWQPETTSSGGGSSWLHFEGVFQAADIWINNVHIFRHTSGYLGFDLSLDSLPVGLLKYGATDAPNVIAMRVDASFGSGHWYEGGGLQRKVWLYHTSSTAHFATDGLFAQTEASSVTKKRAVVVPTAEISRGSASLKVKYTIIDPTGDPVATTTVGCRSAAVHAPVAPAQSRHAQLGSARTASSLPRLVAGDANLTVPNPRLWSVKTPVLYTLVAELLDSSSSNSNEVVDSVNTTIGLRSIDWSSQRGFTLNEEQVHIRGFSHHSDFGGVGGAVADRINVFRANALRSVGGNTWRTSHNPYRPAVYDILDAVGVLVWDENRDFNQMNVMDMERLVRRDRNHPSVVIWSACNEIECWVHGDANLTGKLMRSATKKWDTTRPFSANQNQVNSFQFNDTFDYLSKELDVEGFSHGSINSAGAAQIHSSLPHKAVISSECCSCRTQRGEDYQNDTLGLFYPHSRAQADCMKTCMGLSYPFTPDNPSPNMGVVAGTLGVWTLFDYGGEPGPWPSVSSSFGQFDLAGFPKSASYWYRANWLARVPVSDAGRPSIAGSHVVRISQAWADPPPQHAYPMDQCNYTAFQTLCPVKAAAPQNSKCLACARAHSKELGKLGCTGKSLWPDYCNGVGPGFPTKANQTDVQVFSDAPYVQLLLNGKSLGIRENGAFNYSEFAEIEYATGNLTAVGWSGNPAAQESAQNDAATMLATHTILTAGVPHAILLSVDAPNPMTGTGTALLLDGHDSALVRATVVDAQGVQVQGNGPMVTFGVASGPGQIAGVHNGDAKSHEPQAASHRLAYHGLARAVVRVTQDSVSSDQDVLDFVDVEKGDGVRTVKAKALGGDKKAVADIVITASSPGLVAGKVRIPVSTDAGKHSPLAVAAASGSADAVLSFD